MISPSMAAYQVLDDPEVRLLLAQIQDLYDPALANGRPMPSPVELPLALNSLYHMGLVSLRGMASLRRIVKLVTRWELYLDRMMKPDPTTMYHARPYQHH